MVQTGFETRSPACLPTVLSVKQRRLSAALVYYTHGKSQSTIKVYFRGILVAYVYLN